MKEINCGVLSDVPGNDVELRHLLRMAESLRQIPRHSPLKIALIGPQGAGKSLLINALFGCDGLSVTGADGQACTSTPVRYMSNGKESSKNQQKYSAEIEFLNAVKLEAMISGHARAFFHVYHADEDSDNEDTPTRNSIGQDEMDRRMKDTAEEVFYTLFDGKENFQQGWNSEDYHNGEFERLCERKCQAALDSLNISSRRVLIYTASSIQELLQKVRPFMAKVEGKQSLWPLVSSITIRFSDPLLEENIEIWDVPGM